MGSLGQVSTPSVVFAVFESFSERFRLICLQPAPASVPGLRQRRRQGVATVLTRWHTVFFYSLRTVFLFYRFRLPLFYRFRVDGAGLETVKKPSKMLPGENCKKTSQHFSRNTKHISV